MDPNMNQVNMKTLSLVCPSCGGRMELSPDGETALCPYCGHKMLIEKEDSAQDINTANCLARGQEIRGLRKDTDRIIAALRLDYYNQIKKLAKKYIARGHIYVEEYEDFSRMYDMYHDPDKLDGNGLLKALKEEVDQLEKKVH